ncbi:MAG: TetR/AcrR family transcriptional regulator, partial [Actinoallomurus sp.]
MADHEGGSGVAQLTRRGAATRARILQAAAQLMYARGVAATKLDDVRAVSGTSKSQLYRNFPDKGALVRDVIALQAQQLLADQHQRLRSLRGLERWRDAMVQNNALRNGSYGCPLGSLANELAEQSAEARIALAEHFGTWKSLL